MRAGQGQTLIDMALVASGTAEAAWETAVRSGVSLTDTVGGSDLDVPTTPTDSDTVTELASKGAAPATDGEPSRERQIPIGKATIGKNNKIW